jgi:hypothetical protein
VDLGCVLEDDHVLALAADVTEIGERGRRVGEEPPLELRVHPGLRDDPGAVPGADLGLIRVDQLVEGRRVDQPSLGEEGLERLDPKLDVRQRRVVGMRRVARRGSRMAVTM